ncbi:MAG: energy transducer TonB [Candidatus Scalindua rubra]|uniref:Gram-negative bacterial tonB protein n=1 Tax=Candidatus Scalindua brodae TaxID=237368 RepID=A0A0B0EQV9_9BACT|nr:MAG: Gram-negative bacterial tonB protein [Candidatus Scalindua brodae]MBZ0108895.1 energy transducer TonB [Candidatus Scalindua rubra]
MNYLKSGFAVSFIIHLLFVTPVFFIKKPTAQENMEVVLEFNVTNIIKTGENETDTNTIKTAEVTKNEVSIPAMVKQETKNTVEEEAVVKPDEVIKEEIPEPEKVKQETDITMDEEVLVKDVEVTKKVNQAVADTRRESKSAVNSNRGQSGGIPKSARMQHELVQSAENHYIKEHFDNINKTIRINISYPYKARKMSMEGDVIISFLVCLDGSVKGIKINKSSGFLTLDNNAEKAVRKASPFPPPPVEIRIVLPITYRLNT